MEIVLKRKKKKKKLFIVIIFLIISLFCSIIFINYYSNIVTPVVVKYAEKDIEKIVEIIVNSSLKQVNDEVDINELFNIKYNDKGEIILIDFDSKKSSEVLNRINNVIEYNMKEFEYGNVDLFKDYYTDKDYYMLKKGIVVNVPFGILLNNSLFNNIGPKIPVRVIFKKNIETNFSTDVKEYGINNAYLELDLNINIDIVVILPIVSDDINKSFRFPLSIKIIQGKIPSYYMDGFTSNSNIIGD